MSEYCIPELPVGCTAGDDSYQLYLRVVAAYNYVVASRGGLAGASSRGYLDLFGGACSVGDKIDHVQWQNCIEYGRASRCDVIDAELSGCVERPALRDSPNGVIGANVRECDLGQRFGDVKQGDERIVESVGNRGKDVDQTVDAVSSDGLTEPVRGPNGGISLGRGFFYQRNQANRERKKKILREKKKKNTTEYEVSELQREQLELKRSSTLKWKAQNELAAERAQRELYVLRQNDVQGEVQRYRTKVNAATERNMVSIEKTHGLLKSTGNVPGFHGSVETVVDGEIIASGDASGLTSGSISPDSSISQAEARKAQKDLLDAQSENAELKGKLAMITKKAGFSAEHFELYDKNTWTENDENEVLLDELYPEGYVVNREYCLPGKFQLR